MLESYLRSRLRTKDILLMTHIVLGYPNFEDAFETVREMVAAGVDLMELQIPFSEPIADGPVILRANQQSLNRGTTVQACLDFAREVSRSFDIPFLFMSYYNIIYKYGPDRFVREMAQRGLQGAIVPDLPPEEGTRFLKAMADHGMSPIFIFSPTTPDARMRYLASFGKGFIYCVARRGVTGSRTSFTEPLESYLQRCREATDLPLALGFGVQNKSDIDFLRGKADVAVIGTQTLRLVDRGGPSVVGPFIRGLR